MRRALVTLVILTLATLAIFASDEITAGRLGNGDPGFYVGMCYADNCYLKIEPYNSQGFEGLKITHHDWIAGMEIAPRPAGYFCDHDQNNLLPILGGGC